MEEHVFKSIIDFWYTVGIYIVYILFFLLFPLAGVLIAAIIKLIVEVAKENMELKQQRKSHEHTAEAVKE